ncbi:hypothetical protein C8Q76DRAFT_761838 [Earliella scabrosa]|nr:hypothetical protein C8Q76DRAFT_761838 [Earliella scabrosa]
MHECLLSLRPKIYDVHHTTSRTSLGTVPVTTHPDSTAHVIMEVRATRGNMESAMTSIPDRGDHMPSCAS